MYSETLPSRPEFFEPKESRAANATCGASASLTPGCSTPGSGYASPLTPPQFCTEALRRSKGHTARRLISLKTRRGTSVQCLFGKNPITEGRPTRYFCGPTRSVIGETFTVSHVNARHPSCQPPWIVANIE